MLYVSYDASHAQGWGRQGGTLPDQIFIHFYGSSWPEQMEAPTFADELAWHFAHESAHLYQRQMFTTSKGDEWIHEGAADAFAAIALRPTANAYVRTAEDNAQSKCKELLKGRGVRAAIEAGAFDAAYSCGMLINLALDSRIRSATQHDGLYAVWNNYLARIAGKRGVAGEATYLDAIAEVGDASIAAWVRNEVDVEGAEAFKPVLEVPH
jgi:hypothetical protein